MNTEFTKFVMKVSLYDKDGKVTNNENLLKLLEANSFEDSYLNEHITWDANFIKCINIESIPDNETIIIGVEYTSSLKKLTKYLKDFIENNSPYHDYLTLFYEDDDGYQCAMSIDSVTVMD